ncbi:TIGR02206 family membrane protein [Streptococcus sp. H49]|uniref:YwaF family protein n=1 Tax=Streptococcus huangxiaojuni TaxID=3237239 RepID=UPI0034A57157
MLKDFLTTQATEPPLISLIVYLIMMGALLALVYISVKWHDRPHFVRLFKRIQLLQLLSLYLWYSICLIPISNSLPLYHCRLAMLAILVLPDNSSIKQYFALMGFSGAIFALIYPVLDPYDFPHITGVSFIVGHYALLVNSLNYLLNHYRVKKLSFGKITGYTFILNLFLVGVNHVTGGNYGILRNTPIIDNSRIWFNYLVVSLVLSLSLVLFALYFNHKKNPEKVTSDIK